MSDFKPYWMRHPHQLRVFSLLCLVFLPVLLPAMALYGAWVERWAIWREICGVCYELWCGLTHKMPAKPIIRPLAGALLWFVALLLPQAALIWVFNLYAGNAPLWAFFVFYCGITFTVFTSREHERKKARDNARAQSERLLNDELSRIARQRMAMKASGHA